MFHASDTGRSNHQVIMSRVTQPSVRQIRIAFLITALGGLLFTFDLPLLRLSQADQWTMVFTRGIFLFLSISAVWFFQSP